MQTSPAFVIDIPAQQAWCWLVRGFAAAAGVIVLAWCLLPEQALDQPARFGLAAVAWLVAAWVWAGARVAACRLRWDGALWWIGPAGGDLEHMVGGNLRVMIGLSSFLLLRFDGGPSASRRVRWVPVLRGGLQARWHALCCAVYSARPDTGSFLNGDLPRTAPTRPEPHE